MTKRDSMFTPQSLPNQFLTLLKAGLKGNHYTVGLAHNGMLVPPSLSMEPIHLELGPMAAKQVHRYHKLVNWTDSEMLHPCLLHILAFPLHLLLMTRADFPFKLLGLIHISNQISQFRPIKADDQLLLSCYLTDIQRHVKGWVFTLQTEVRVKDQLCWQAKSINLFQDGSQHGSRTASHGPVTKFDGGSQQFWQLGSDLGRRYALISGDFNPIHLNGTCARLFGLKRQVAHGMCSKARCISALYQLYPDYFNVAFSVQTKFIKPIFLPAKISFIQSDKIVGGESQEIAFSLSATTSLTERETQVPHLTGAIKVI